ncbi:ABC transporter ATP-binding protein [Curtobacterium sp. MCBD17_021]|uniref:ABC transporter ATP-binding protein n=1 Tax=Curtobacterium sp. MCBD17_021 TaxID=2175665 RepID=UPI0015E8B1E9|nr:ATP-binding cassette domain-containing protein [Curtobacterium sp. MCBD17_021]
MTNRRPLLTASNLGYDLGTRTLWDGLDLVVTPGDVIAIGGPSGAGKSTLLRCLGGLDRPHRGMVRIGDVELHQSSARVRRRLRREVLGFVMQDHAVVPDWTVGQNLRVVRPAGVPRAVLEARVQDALVVVGLGGRSRARVGRLSGGEQQRVAVARVLVQRPRVVLADEPTASLDEGSAERVRLGLDVLRTAGSAILVATHDPALVAWAGASLHVGASTARH